MKKLRKLSEIVLFPTASFLVNNINFLELIAFIWFLGRIIVIWYRFYWERISKKNIPEFIVWKKV